MKLQTARNAQWPLTQVFEFDINDTIVGTNGVEVGLKATSVLADAFNLPQNSVVVGGDIVVLTASDETGTATLSIGDSGVATRYASAVNLKAAARTALTLTGYTNAGGLNGRITVANQNGNATVGRVRITLTYIVLGRANEVQTH